MEVYHKPPRTRASTWVPRRVYYVLRFLQRRLTAGQSQPLSNKQVKDAIKFGSEGEVSQIMRYLAGEQPTMGHWAYGALNMHAQTYRFITRDRLPSGGYSITLLPTPERIDAPQLVLPEIVQLSFFGAENDPSMIPQIGQQDALQGGSFVHDPFARADLPLANAEECRSQRDQHEHRSHESNSSSMSVLAQKNDWSGVTPDGMDFLPILALEKAGVTPHVFQEADRKIATRREYDRPAQIRILIRSLLTSQPIYSAAEIAAHEQESPHERPSRSTARRDATDHGTDRPGRSNRRENRQQPRAAAQRFTRASYQRHDP